MVNIGLDSIRAKDPNNHSDTETVTLSIQFNLKTLRKAIITIIYHYRLDHQFHHHGHQTLPRVCSDGAVQVASPLLLLRPFF